jgi:polygalacturonase
MINRSILILIGSYLLTTVAARANLPVATGYNVRDYGAKGDGIALDSKAINRAIDAAAKAGGGTVFVPAGSYLSGSIHLKSNISLYLDQGAIIIATQSEANGEYDPEEATVNMTYQDYGHSHFHNSLIWGEDLHDVSILGQGLIWGKGLLRDSKKDSKLGNKAIAFLRCRNVLIRDISILTGGWFGILATGTDNLTINNVKEDTNRDGMDIDCCKNVKVSDCFVNSPYDDGICLKSSYALGYARNTENVTITNCEVSGYDEGSFLDGTFKRTKSEHSGFHPTGRIKLGTESNGGFKNITISNCVFDYCRGLALETVDGAELEDVAVTNITMRDVVSDPIFLRLGSRMRGPAGTPIGQLRRILISNVVIYNADSHYVCTISGIPGNAIEDVTLSNIKLYVKRDSTASGYQANPPEYEDKYPEPGMFGEAPAYGFFIRHAKNIKITAVEICMLKSDTRPVLRADDVQGLYVRELTSPGMTLNNKPVFNQVSDLQLTNSLKL